MISSKFERLTKRFNRIKDFCLIIIGSITVICDIIKFKEQLAY